ncbi:LPS assembly lipoprotein LptE [Aquamicrobium sp. LC103]|uniref:LPS assembly lipoprotein LptE n=1 Tax=Aquamicrobium sp. LC103 TaxID=1120658 RepID=UPI0009E1ECCE|nr:LPS assembly lipoprotein LptE [Aquamicrobium sp. LC103]TKT82974.1 hypothetical protein XW59_003145 [Aquamicrobium sp. LC103]
MSLPDHRRRVRKALLAGAALGLVALAGCTVRPLYGDVTSATAPGGATSAALASVAINPVNDRVGQEVRNQLIFLLNGGAGQSASPVHTVDLRVTSRRTSAARVQPTTQDLEPTAAVVTVRAGYTITERATGRRIAAGTRQVVSPYDIPRQEFAAVRAERDAENRAARELAELLRLVIAQELVKPSSNAIPAIVSSPDELEGISNVRTPGQLEVR